MIIGHYEQDIWAPGGLSAYIRRIAQFQQEMGHTLYYFSHYASSSPDCNPVNVIQVKSDDELYAHAQLLRLDILHLHGEVTISPPENLAIVRTLQGHQPYCPSASKFFKQSNQPCDRSYGAISCLQGHLFHRCGTVRPAQLIQSFQRTAQIRKVLPKFPVVVVSQFLKDRLVEAGYPAESIHVIYLFAPKIFKPIPPPQGDIPRFVFLGRFTPEKGLSWLLQAIAQVSVPIHLDIAGHGQQEAQIRQQIQQLKLGDRVTLHGWVDEAATEQLIQQVRAVVYPSLWHEPGGTVAFETMAQGRALIMSRVGGMPEIVQDQVNGLLVEPNDIKGLAAQIQRLATDWTLAKQLGEQGQQLAQQTFGLQNHMQALMRIYEQVSNASSKITLLQT